MDFPRFPYPSSAEVFRDVSEKGEQLRQLHLIEPAAFFDTPYPYEREGDDVVASGFSKFEGRRVQVNNDQYFANVLKLAWEFTSVVTSLRRSGSRIDGGVRYRSMTSGSEDASVISTTHTFS